MSAETLLNHLSKVRQNGPGRWMACCPGHDDQSPSLSVKEEADGHTLIHCFAGCSPEEIMGSMGLQMSDLFPEKDAHSFNDDPHKNQSQKRETRLEEEKNNLEFRLMNYISMIKNGHRFSPKEDEENRQNFNRLQQIKGYSA